MGTTRQRKTKQKHNTLYVGHHYAQANTNNANKTCTKLHLFRNNHLDGKKKV